MEENGVLARHTPTADFRGMSFQSGWSDLAQSKGRHSTELKLNQCVILHRHKPFSGHHWDDEKRRGTILQSIKWTERQSSTESDDK